jgi:hypothetical protein
VKVEYLKEGSDDCPLVRLYQFRRTEVQRLRQTFEDLAAGRAEHVRLDKVTDVESIDGTQLTYSRGARDRGVIPSGPNRFDVVLAPEGWQRCAGLAEPFCESNSGYQWLYDLGPVRLLLSHDGCW